MADATRLCQDLGYLEGSVVAVKSNSCPEVSHNGFGWFSDFASSKGFGKTFTCTSPVPTPVPTLAPTPVPTPVPPTPALARCSDLLVTYDVWGRSAKGVD